MSAGAIPVLNPWAFCENCGDGVHARAAGRNLPCGHAAAVGSVCATWDPDRGCRCSEAVELEPVDDAAVALQEALEQHEREFRNAAGEVCVVAPPVLRAVRFVEPPAERPEDPLLEQAGHWRAVLGWGALLVAMLAVMALWSAGGPW